MSDKKKYIVTKAVGAYKKGEVLELASVPLGLQAHVEPFNGDVKATDTAEVKKLKAENTKLKKEIDDLKAAKTLEVATPESAK